MFKKLIIAMCLAASLIVLATGCQMLKDIKNKTSNSDIPILPDNNPSSGSDIVN